MTCKRVSDQIMCYVICVLGYVMCYVNKILCKKEIVTMNHCMKILVKSLNQIESNLKREWIISNWMK